MEEVDGEKYLMGLGRIGPGTALGDYLTQGQSFIEEVKYKETVVATTLCSAFVINKYDFFYRIPPEIKDDLKQSVHDSYVRPPATVLFENTTKKMGEYEWRIKKTWDAYKVFECDFIGIDHSYYV